MNYINNPVTGSQLIDSKATRGASSSSNPIIRLWYGLSEPRVITMVMLWFYGSSIAYGCYQLYKPAMHLEEQLSSPLGFIIGLTFIIGGLIGVLVAPKGYWQFERAALVFLATGVFVHLVWALYDPAPGIRWGQVYRLAVENGLILIRWYMIRWARMDPEK